MNVPVAAAAKVLPIRNIVLSAFHKGPSDMLLALSFVSQLLLAGSHSDVFQPHYPWLRNILAALHASPNIMLHCALEVEILFNSLFLSLSDIQEDIKEHAVHYPLQFSAVPFIHSAMQACSDSIVNDVDVRTCCDTSTTC